MKNYVLGFVSCLVLVIGVIVPLIWPPELSYIFNSLFWSAVGLLICSCVLVAYLYWNGGTTQRVHFYFALLLIVSAAFMYSGFEQVSMNAAIWEPFLKERFPKVFILLPQFINYTKNIIAFGFAALGASVAANVISSRFAARQVEPVPAKKELTDDKSAVQAKAGRGRSK